MKLKLTQLFVCISIYCYAQTPPIGNPPTPVNNTANNAASAWYTGGNNPVGATPATSNIFGTMWNSPIFHQTNGITRMQMNGTVSNVVNGGANLPKDGFIGIGNPIVFITVMVLA